PAGGDHLPDGGDLHVRVEVVAEQRPLHTALAQRLLGARVIGDDERRVAGHRLRNRGADDVPHPGLGGDLDGALVLVEAGADRGGGDEQQPLDARERGGERVRLGEVDPPHRRAARGEVGERGRVAGGEHHLARVGELQQALGGAAAEPAGGAGDRDGHVPSYSQSYWLRLMARNCSRDGYVWQDGAMARSTNTRFAVAVHVLTYL